MSVTQKVKKAQSDAMIACRWWLDAVVAGLWSLSLGRPAAGCVARFSCDALFLDDACRRDFPGDCLSLRYLILHYSKKEIRRDEDG